MATGLFDGIGEASVSRGGLYYKPGSYRVRILSVKVTKSRKKADLFIIETEVLKSDNPDLPVGSKPSQVINFAHEPALSNIKTFVAANLGVDPKEHPKLADRQVDEEMCELVVSDAQPFKGNELLLACANTTTQQGNDFTIHEWSPTPELKAKMAQAA